MPHHSSGPADGGALAERSSTITLLALAFILSGAAGLIYESIWSRYLGLFVGHSAYAQIIVLVIFLGGMSIGAFAAGERSERLRRPLLWYAGVELLVGAIGFGFHHLFVVVSGAAYDHWFPALAGQATGAGSLAFLAVKWGLAGLLILPQSILLGATFPLMSAGAVRLAGDRTGHTLGLLYFANSLGAAVGVLLAGFVLLAAVGLPGTLTTAAVLNVVVAVGVGMLEWGMGTGDRGPGNVRAQLRGASTPGHPEAVPPNPEPPPPAPRP